MQPLSGCIVSRPGFTTPGRKAVRCNANGGWPWSRRKAVPPPPPPPPPPAQQQTGDAAADDLLRTSPKWRSWPTNGVPFSPPNPGSMQGKPQQQLSPEQQAALQDMLIDSTINPKWRWPSFGSNSSPPSNQQPSNQQQPQQLWPQQAPPPPPPPPQQRGAGRGWQLKQQQQQQPLYEQQQQQMYDAQPSSLPQQQRQQQQWQWPFIGQAFDPTPEDEFRERLEAMGVDLAGKRGRQKQQQQQSQTQDVLQSFEQMDDREVARYMNQLRQSRLERVQNRQDDEVVGIAGLYLSITLLILFMAALTNLPT